MKSASNRGVVHDRLQVLHVHVFLAAPLGARHMAEPRADQHQGRVSVRECPHHAGAPTDLTVQPLDHVVGANTRPMLAGEVTVGQRLLDAVLDLLGGLLQLHGAQLGDHGFRLLAGRFLALLRVKMRQGRKERAIPSFPPLLTQNQLLSAPLVPLFPDCSDPSLGQRLGQCFNTQHCEKTRSKLWQSDIHWNTEKPHSL